MIWAAAGIVVALTALAGALGWRRARRPGLRIDSVDEATTAVEQALPAFRAASVALGADGRAALVVDGGGRVALASVRGRRIVAQDIGWNRVRATADGLLVESEGAPVLLAGVDQLEVRRLTAAGA